MEFDTIRYHTLISVQFHCWWWFGISCFSFSGENGLSFAASLFWWAPAQAFYSNNKNYIRDYIVKSEMLSRSFWNLLHQISISILSSISQKKNLPYSYKQISTYFFEIKVTDKETASLFDLIWIFYSFLSFIFLHFILTSHNYGMVVKPLKGFTNNSLIT